MIFIIMNLKEQIFRIKKLMTEEISNEISEQFNFDDVRGKYIQVVDPNSERAGYVRLINMDQAKELDADINKVYSNKEWCVKNCEPNFFNQDNSLFIHSLFVDPKHRKMGHAKKLMNYCADQGKEKGYKYITLLTNTDNIAAQKLYDGLGYDVHCKNDDLIFYFLPL
jgi:ribosomal protein S18 acetylase RimI-like enzyme